MTRFVIDEPNFRALVRGEVIAVGSDIQIMVSSNIGWVKMFRAVLDAISPPMPETTRPNPPDPPQAREFLPNSKRSRRE